MSLADMTTQVLIEGKNITAATTASNLGASDRNRHDFDSFDVARTLRWALVGLVLHGPYFSTGMSFIDRRIAGKVNSWKTVAKKTAAAQFFLFPPYLVVLFGTMGFLEGDKDIKRKIEQRVPEAFLNGCIYWPIANAINFKLVPNNLRVPYLALSAGIWNSYLSFANQKGRDNKVL